MDRFIPCLSSDPEDSIVSVPFKPGYNFFKLHVGVISSNPSFLKIYNSLKWKFRESNFN